MKILVTAGSTIVPIDHVHRITTPFRGRTGTQIANYLAYRGHDVLLLTSQLGFQPDTYISGTIQVRCFQTYDEFIALMESQVREGGFDMIIHNAVVNNYKVTGRVFKTNDFGSFTADGKVVTIRALKDQSQISRDHDRLFIELKPAIQVIDHIRDEWGFTGILARFKLHHPLTDVARVALAKKSRDVVDADVIVLTAYDDLKGPAHVMGKCGPMIEVNRKYLADAIMKCVEANPSVPEPKKKPGNSKPSE